MAQATKAKCNNLQCDLAQSDELIEIPQDGNCPDCGKPLHANGGDGNSPTDEAKRKRKILMIIGVGIGSLFTIGLLLLAFSGSDSNPPSQTDLGKDKKVPGSNKIPPKPVSPPELTLKPPTPPTPVVGSTSAEPSLETQQHVKQAMMFVSLAKQNPKTHDENIRNALAEFDSAIKQEETQRRCYAVAYMDRGIAYLQDKKPNLAEKDLLKASECDNKNPDIFYNLATYYAVINKNDLALESLKKALDLGFNNCEILRGDSDLKNLRKQDDFRRVLEQHKLFCLR